MELTWIAPQASCSFAVRVPAVAARASSVSHAFIRNPARNGCFVSSKLKGSASLVDPLKLRNFCLTAVASDRTVIPNDSSQEHLSSSDASLIDDEQSRNGENMEEKVELDSRMIKVCDKLIGVFMVDKPTPTEWRRLLAFSRKWNNLRPHFYIRCKDRADSEENPEMKHKLLRLVRKLNGVDKDVQRHNELIEVIRGSSSEIDISEIIRKRRKDFTKEFFVHLHTVAMSHKDKTEQDALANLGTMCLAAVQAYDKAADSIEAINAAELKFQDILNSSTVQDACRKIDVLAQKDELDPALLMMMTKAWSEAKESTMMKDEAKELLYKIYVTGIGNLQRQIPKEIRILKYVITIRDPERLVSVLNDAFTPGQELEGETVDTLYTTPKKLLAQIKIIVDAYYSSVGDAVVREAKDMLRPSTIAKMENVKKVIEERFI